MGGEAGGGGAGDDFGGARNAAAFAGNASNPFGGALDSGGSGEAASNLADAAAANAAITGQANSQAISGVAPGQSTATGFNTANTLASGNKISGGAVSAINNAKPGGGNSLTGNLDDATSLLGGAGSGGGATGTLLGDGEKIGVAKPGVNKLGNNSIPNGANQGIPTLQDIENLPEGGPTRPATDADKQLAKDTAELGALRGGFGNTVQRAVNFAKENPVTAAASIFSPIPGTGALIAGAALKSGFATSKLNDAFNSGLITSEGLAPARGKAPSFDGVFGGDNNNDNNNLTSTAPRRVNAPTPQAAGSTAAQPQNLSFLQRLERQRGRAASSSTGASGQGRNASRTLLGT